MRRIKKEFFKLSAALTVASFAISGFVFSVLDQVRTGSRDSTGAVLFLVSFVLLSALCRTLFDRVAHMVRAYERRHR